MAKIEVRWLWAFIALETTNSAPRLALRSLATLAHPSLWGHLYFAELGTFLFCIDSFFVTRFLSSIQCEMRLQCLYIQIVNTLFNGLYAPFAWAYDWVADMVSLGRWQKWILAIQPLLEHDPILELGFGPGHLQTALLKSHRNVTGVDLSRQMCKIAGQRVTREGHAPRLVRAMGQNLPFPDEAFACLIATFPAPYLFQAEAAREAARVLAPGARMVILAYAEFHGTTLPEKILRKIFRQTGQEPTDAWITERLLAAFHQAGFETKIQRVQCDTDVLLVLVMKKKEDCQSAL